jgi:hypothetical protein
MKIQPLMWATARMAAMAARPRAFGGEWHHLIGHHGEIEGLLVGARHHLLHLLQAAAGRLLLGRELVGRDGVEPLQHVDRVARLGLGVGRRGPASRCPRRSMRPAARSPHLRRRRNGPRSGPNSDR